MISAGTVLGERYRLETRIAIGGMGEVWSAQDETLGRTVAVKVLKPEYAEDPTFVERFRAEARNTARLAHAGIATVYDYGEVPVEGALGSSAYLVMELVPGKPLSAILHERGQLRPSETMSIVGQTALALQAAHERGVIHRDIKPGNLMITPDGRVKVTDFGIARATDEVPLTQTGTVLGTSYYLAPEQAAGREVTAASDVYSLGIVAYECLAGRRPFSDTNPVAVALAHQTQPPPPLPSTVPPPITQLVYASLSKDPRDRPPTAGEFGRRALALADPTATGAMAAPTAATEVIGSRTGVVAPVPVPLREPVPPPPPKRKIPLSVPLIGLLVLLAVLLTILLLRNDNKKAGNGTPSTTPTTAPPTSASVSPTPSPTTPPPTTPPPTTPPPTTPPPTTPPATVTINPNDYIGRTLSSAQASLQRKGLQVQVQGSSDPTSTVTAISPSGVVNKTQIITLITQAPPTTPPPTGSASASASPPGLTGQGNGNAVVVGRTHKPGKGAGQGG
ncbi:MAG TPA: serine/threonine-protein kinase [Frankiaceae bacterium]|nr:serine/threonine-protein kinase [Frankiaceae bacterium]